MPTIPPSSLWSSSWNPNTILRNSRSRIGYSETAIDSVGSHLAGVDAGGGGSSVDRPLVLVVLRDETHSVQ